MKDIKVLGTGCANCKTTIALIEQVAKAKDISVSVQKVEELKDIMSYGVMSTPGVVIDGQPSTREAFRPATGSSNG